MTPCVSLGEVQHLPRGRGEAGEGDPLAPKAAGR